MSALAGICHWDQRPISDSDVAALAAASRHAGPDGGGTVRPRPGLVLQAHVLHFDRLSSAERQPFTFGRGSVLTWDGRLDNRDDLLVPLHRDLGSDRSDAALVAAAYARWGLDCLVQLVGDWSLAIWDAMASRLVLACDYMGNRPLYYLERPQSFAWATCMEALIDGCHLAREPNESYIAAKLASAPSDFDITPFNGVRTLLGGHVVVATPAHVQLTRYWTFTPDTIRYQQPQDYTDRLRELLTDAVRVRLRNNATVWAHLSGGWDSSSVVCLAHRLITSGQVEAPRLQPISHLWPRSAECDDASFMKAVERWCDLPTLYVDVRGNCTVKEMLEGHRWPRNWRTFEREAPVLDAGGRVILTGVAGDHAMQNGSIARLALLDHLYQGHLLQFLQQCMFAAMQWHRPFVATVLDLFREAYLPRRQRRKEQKFFGVTPELISRLPTYVETKPPVVGFSPIKRPFVETLYLYMAHLPSHALTDRLSNLWWTHPYLHRPLIDFILAVPPLVLWDPSGPRAAMKRALADVLPPEILARRNKSNFVTAWERADRQTVDDLADSRTLLGPADQWHIVKRGYVDPAVLTRALEAPSEHRGKLFLMPCVDIEIWLRTLTTSTPFGVDTGRPVTPPPQVLPAVHSSV